MSHTPLISRAAAGLVAPRSVTRRDLTEDTAHYGGPSPWGTLADRSSAARFAATTDHARCATIWRGYQRYHMLTRGWQDIAYSSAVCPHGYRLEGRGPDVRTAAQGTVTGNNVSHATCYLAGAGDPLTDPAKAAYQDEHERLEGLDKGHRDWKPTSCPGDPLYTWVHAGRPGGSPPVGHPPTAGVLRLTSPYMRGDEVENWQLILAGAGLLPASGVDGVFGPNTERATKLFQAQLGIKADGIVGPVTRTATGKLLAWLAAVSRQAPAPEYPGLARLRTPRQTGAIVSAWQRQFNTRGYGLKVDGVFGLATNHVVWHFQRAQRLTVDGIAGPATWRALVS